MILEHGVCKIPLELYKSGKSTDIELNPTFVDVFNFRPLSDVQDCRFEARWTLDTGETVVMRIEYGCALHCVYMIINVGGTCKLIISQLLYPYRAFLSAIRIQWDYTCLGL